MRDFVVGGLLMSPFIKYALLALLVFLPLRFVLVRLQFQKWFWHPVLAEAALYVTILASLNILV